MAVTGLTSNDTFLVPNFIRVSRAADSPVQLCSGSHLTSRLSQSGSQPPRGQPLWFSGILHTQIEQYPFLGFFMYLNQLPGLIASKLS